MMLRKHMSFRLKVTGAMVLISLLTLLLSYGFLLEFELRRFKENVALRLGSLAEVTGHNSSSALMFDDREEALLTLSGLAAEDDILEAGLFSSDGELVARFERVPGAAEPSPSYRMAGDYFERGRISVSRAVAWKGESVGSLYIIADQSGLYSRLMRYAGYSGLVLVISLLGAIGLAAIFYKVVFNPVSTLTKTAKQISEARDYSVRVDVGSRDDELGLLMQSFNEMLGQIQDRDAALRDAQELLEKRIEERTAALTTEIAVRQEAELSNRRMSQVLEGVLDNMPVIVFRTDPDGVFTESIGSGLKRLGLEPNQVVGKSSYELYPAIADAIRATTKGSTRISEVGGELDGEPWHFFISLFPDEYNQGHIVGFALDITARKVSELQEKTLQERLVRSERMESLGILAGGVAHDLNNILGPMVAFPELIKDSIQAEMGESTPGMTEAIEDLAVMEDCAARAASVIRDLLTLGRRENVQKVPLDLNAVVKGAISKHDVVDIFERNGGIRLETSCWDGPLPIIGSGSHLFRVISNLIGNASEAVDGEGTISVRTALVELPHATTDSYEVIPAGSHAVISIADTGTGIGADDLTHIFEPFFTRKKQSSRSGSGLGLSVVHGVVKNHNGYVDVRSRIDKGTIFELYFPITEDVAENVANTDDIEGGNEHVLVVDDEPVQLAVATRALSGLGYTVDTAANGTEAIEIYKNAFEEDRSPFDILVLDMIMEEHRDGLDTMRAIHAVNPDQKILLVSGFSATDRVSAALSEGAEWLAKPYTRHGIATALRSLLDQPVT